MNCISSTFPAMAVPVAAAARPVVATGEMIDFVLRKADQVPAVLKSQRHLICLLFCPGWTVKDKRRLLTFAPDIFIKTLSAICVQILTRGLPINTKAEISSLRRFKTTLNKLAAPRVAVTVKRRLLKRNVTKLGALFSPLLKEFCRVYSELQEQKQQ